MNKFLKRVLKQLKRFNREGSLENVEIETVGDVTTDSDGIKNYHGTWYIIKFYRRAKHDYSRD